MNYSRFLKTDAMLERVKKSAELDVLKRAVSRETGYISLLDGDRLQLNYGTTKIITVRFLRNGSVEITGFQNVPVEELSLREIQNQEREVPSSRLVEGKWHDAICHMPFVTLGDSRERWWVVDREAVIGFAREGRAGKRDFWKKRFAEPVKAEAEHLATKFGSSRIKVRYGDELDLLALSSAGELGCWEVKHAGSADLDFAPAQASVYRLGYQAAIDDISDDIKKMVQQKVSLGILTKDVEAALPAGKFKKVNAAVIVGSMSCANAPKGLLREFSDHFDVPVYTLPSNRLDRFA